MFNFNFTFMEKISHDDYENFVECTMTISKQAEYLVNLASELSGKSYQSIVLFASARVLSLALHLQDDCACLEKFLDTSLSTGDLRKSVKLQEFIDKTSHDGPVFLGSIDNE